MGNSNTISILQFTVQPCSPSPQPFELHSNPTHQLIARAWSE